MANTVQELLEREQAGRKVANTVPELLEREQTGRKVANTVPELLERERTGRKKTKTGQNQLGREQAGRIIGKTGQGRKREGKELLAPQPRITKRGSWPRRKSFGGFSARPASGQAVCD